MIHLRTCLSVTLSLSITVIGLAQQKQTDRLQPGTGSLAGRLEKNRIWVVAHRGDWRNAPENSIRGFLSAAEMGVDAVELDLKKTSDGEIVIMHDETINRTTNGKGKVSDYTLAQLKTFGLRNGLGGSTNNRIPTLREVMLALKGKVLVNLDKSYHYYEEAFAILKETGTLQQAIFKSEMGYSSLAGRYPRLIDSIIYMAVVDIGEPGAADTINEYLGHMHPFAFELNFQQDTSSLLANNGFIPRSGARIWMNSLWSSLDGGHDDDKAVEENNIADSWDWLISHGATILQTDRPALLLSYLRRRGLHD